MEDVQIVVANWLKGMVNTGRSGGAAIILIADLLHPLTLKRVKSKWRRDVLFYSAMRILSQLNNIKTTVLATP